MRFFAIILLTFSFTGFCSAPAGWKDKSRLFGPDIKKTERLKEDRQKVRVMIYTGKPVAIKSSSGFEFQDIKNQVKKGNGVFLPNSPGKYITEKSEFYLKDKLYYGDLLILEDDKKFAYVNIVPIDEYLVSVVGHEMSPAWPIEALKAQAVLARTYVLQKMKDSKDKLYDIGNTTKYQVYTGHLDNDETVRAAIKETRDQVVKYKGELANVFFHSDCGGQTAAASEVWKEDIPYLPQKRCDFKDSPEYKWEISVSQNIIEKKLGLQNIEKVKVKERTKSKRVKTLEISSRKGKDEISASEFRNRLGPEKVKSTLFGVRYTGGVLTIRGNGYGHGVGMCQWCAKIMVEKRSMRYQGILRYFFPGTKIERI
jgi:stage II sporulation protein D